MVQEAIKLGELAGREEPRFRVGGQILAGTARLLGGLRLLPRSLRDGQTKVLPPQEPDRSDVDNRLKQAASEFNTQPHTPELITRTFQAIWQVRGELIGATYEVSPCPYTQEQLADLEAHGRRMGYLPAQLATQQTRHLLGRMFPEMKSYSVREGNPVTNDRSPSVWFDYEAADAPYTDTTENQLMARVKADGRELLNLNQYIVAAQDSKLFTGHYLDEGRTWVRLASRDGGHVVDVYFLADGRLDVSWGVLVGAHAPDLGGRSSGVKKA